jgi:broad specificity phosphatase PhoE
MDLIMIRHGIALDAARALRLASIGRPRTPKGAQRTHGSAAGLRAIPSGSAWVASSGNRCATG